MKQDIGRHRSYFESVLFTDTREPTPVPDTDPSLARLRTLGGKGVLGISYVTHLGLIQFARARFFVHRFLSTSKNCGFPWEFGWLGEPSPTEIIFF